MECARDHRIAQVLGGLAADRIGDQFHADHQTLAAHVADHRMALLQITKPGDEVIADPRGVCGVVAFHQFQCRQRRRAAEWIAAIGVAVRAALPLLHDGFLRDHQPDRHA